MQGKGNIFLSMKTAFGTNSLTIVITVANGLLGSKSRMENHFLIKSSAVVIEETREVQKCSTSGASSIAGVPMQQ